METPTLSVWNERGTPRTGALVLFHETQMQRAWAGWGRRGGGGVGGCWFNPRGCTLHSSRVHMALHAAAPNPERPSLPISLPLPPSLPPFLSWKQMLQGCLWSKYPQVLRGKSEEPHCLSDIRNPPKLPRACNCIPEWPEAFINSQASCPRNPNPSVPSLSHKFTN